jgi:hypothetical protein
VYHLVVVGRDGSGARVVETPDLNANGGPAMVSPDGTLAAVRAEIDTDPTPGDVLIVSPDGEADPVRIRALMWNSVAWQPVVNEQNPWASAPDGLPALP